MARNYVTVALCIDAAGIVCGAGSMKRSGVRLSVCLSVPSFVDSSSGATARRSAANASSVMLTANVGS